MMRISYLACGALLTISLPLHAALDGDEPFLCSPRVVHECDELDGCDVARPGEVGLAGFARVDLKNRRIEALDLDRVTPIEHVEHPEGGWLITGGDGILAWSAAIAEDDGNLTLTIVGDGFTFSVFGGCIQYPE